VAQKIKICTDMDTVNMRSQISLFEKLASSNCDVLIDMDDVTFIDSSGVGGLVFYSNDCGSTDIRCKSLASRGSL
jgi:anti-anti-sigma regulatory factor